MNIEKFYNKQFLKIIEWVDDSSQLLVYKYPFIDNEIRTGSMLVVRDFQVAIFVDEGRLADVFGSGTYKLETENLPILTALKNWDKQFESSFKSDVYFISTRINIDRKWGTSNSITLRDEEFGIIQIRAFGTYSYQVYDSVKLYEFFSGMEGNEFVDHLEQQLKSIIATAFMDIVTNLKQNFIDISRSTSDIARKLEHVANENTLKLGIEVKQIYILNISLPDQLQNLVNARVGMNMLGGEQPYLILQAIEKSQYSPVSAKVLVEHLISDFGSKSSKDGLTNKNKEGTSTANQDDGRYNGNYIEEVERSYRLMKEGILTQEEFEKIKSKILEGIG